MTSRVTVNEAAAAATAAMERNCLGEYRLEGPGRNIFLTRSWEGWNSLVNELTREGYILVTSAEYAEISGVSDAEVARRISREGSLFALLYQAGPVVRCAVPLDERDEPQPPRREPAATFRRQC